MHKMKKTLAKVLALLLALSVFPFAACSSGTVVPGSQAAIFGPFS